MKKKVFKKSPVFYETYFRKPGEDKKNTHYCPGCGHGIVHKLIAETIEDFGIQDKTIIISPVGCSVFAYYYFDLGNIQVAHGRAPAVATALKRANPESIVISYQGDGDLAAIGGNNLIQSANRGENFTTIFINNAIYGMTGGQMAPTTLLGQKTLTSPFGRRVEEAGYPIKVTEMIMNLENVAYLERTSLHDNKNLMKTRKAIRRGIQNQMENKGYSLIEVLSQCPTGWKISPVKSLKYIEEKMLPVFPLGVYKDTTKEREFYYLEKSKKTDDELFNILGLKEKKLSHSYENKKIEARYRNPKIIIAGFGGQGVLLLGEGLAQAAMHQDYHVTWIPSYGPEMRGGTANCQVIISEDRIASPIIEQPNVLIALNKPSLDKFAPDIAPDGLILYNSSLIEEQFTDSNHEIIGVPFTQIAEKLGSAKTANMIALGAYAELTKLFDPDELIELLPKFLKRKEFLELNKNAIQAGQNAVRETFSKRK